MEARGACFHPVGAEDARYAVARVAWGLGDLEIGSVGEFALDTLLVCAALLCAAPAQQTLPQDLWFAEDKLKHFAFSYLITSGSAAAARTVTGRDESVLIGAGVGLLAGITKELYDKKSNRSSSFKDLIWDAAGVAIGVFVARQTR